MWSNDVPSLVLGSKGLIALQIDVRGAESDLHSGLHPSASTLLVELRVCIGAHVLGNLLGGVAGRRVFLSCISAARARAGRA